MVKAKGIKTISIGQLPVYCGIWRTDYNNGNGYHLYNHVTCYGSEFVNKIEGNKNPPITLTIDSSGRWTDYKLNDGWEFSANAIDISIGSLNYDHYTHDSSIHEMLSLLSDKIDELKKREEQSSDFVNYWE